MNHHHNTPSLLRFFPIILGFIAAAAFGGPTMGAAQQRLHDGADALHKAKTSVHPIEDLETAKHSLQEALHNKKGHRIEAIEIIDKAIAQLKAGDRITAGKTIDEAISEVDKAVGAGHKNLPAPKHRKK